MTRNFSSDVRAEGVMQCKWACMTDGPSFLSFLQMIEIANKRGYRAFGPKIDGNPSNVLSDICTRWLSTQNHEKIDVCPHFFVWSWWNCFFNPWLGRRRVLATHIKIREFRSPHSKWTLREVTDWVVFQYLMNHWPRKCWTTLCSAGLQFASFGSPSSETWDDRQSLTRLIFLYLRYCRISVYVKFGRMSILSRLLQFWNRFAAHSTYVIELVTW